MLLVFLSFDNNKLKEALPHVLQTCFCYKLQVRAHGETVTQIMGDHAS